MCQHTQTKEISIHPKDHQDCMYRSSYISALACRRLLLTLLLNVDVFENLKMLKSFSLSPLKGVCAPPGSDVPHRASRYRGRTTGQRTELWRPQWWGSSCCLQLQTPEEEEELLFPWKHDHFLWSRSSSVWTVPARQSGKDTLDGHNQIYGAFDHYMQTFIQSRVSVVFYHRESYEDFWKHISFDRENNVHMTTFSHSWSEEKREIKHAKN